MRAPILLLALLVPAMAAATAPAPAPPARGLWIDWNTLSRRAAQAPVQASSEAEARALGDRVGRMVAAGDCRGGERIALEAGDARLVAAVRRYCFR